MSSWMSARGQLLSLFLYVLVVVCPVCPASLRYEVSKSQIVYNKLMGAVNDRFDHSRPSLVDIDGHDGSSSHTDISEGARMYILCFSYLSLSEAEGALRSQGLRFGHYYSSYTKDLGCLLALLDRKEKTALFFEDIGIEAPCHLILPLGNVRKLDNSLLTGLTYMYHSALAKTSQDARMMLQRMEEEHIIAHHLADRLLGDETQETASPMQITIGVNASWTRISNVRNDSNSAELHEKFIERWLSRDYLQLFSHVSEFLDFKVKGRHHDLKYHNLHGDTFNRQKDRGSPKLIDSIVYLSSLRPDVNSVRTDWKENRGGSVDRQNYEGHRDNDNSPCDFSTLKFVSHNNRIDVRLALDSMKGVKHSTCLFHFVRAVSTDPAVTSMSLSPGIRLLNYHARCIIQSGSYSSEPWSSLGLDGEGQIVGVSDTGIDENSCFFRDSYHGKVIKSSIDNPQVDHKNRKIVEYITYSNNYGDVEAGHGSHVCGTIAGSCMQNDHSASSNIKKYHGIAPKAKIAFFDIMGDDGSGELFIPYYFQDLFEPAYFAGAKLHSDSWGGGYSYDSFCLDVDEYTYNHPDFLTFFAAGNDGSQGARTILSPAMAKNAVAVGGSISSSDSTKMKTVASFSAEGPTMDGRIKPDIVVPGESLYSARGHRHSSSETCDLVYKQGTSMATPVAAGAAALIRQYFEDPSFWGAFCNTILPYSNVDLASFSNFESLCNEEGISVSASLLKTLVIHGGTDMVAGRSVTDSPPDFRQGFGLLSLTTLLPKASFESWSHYLFIDEAYISSFQQRAYTIIIHETGTNDPIKVTLSWMDPPNPEFAAKVVLHDLDIVLTTPEGNTFYGNDKRRTGASRDELNNVEQIILPPSTISSAGLYVIRVQSKLLTQSDHQKFSIVITSDISSYVSGISETTLSPSTFDECASSPSVSSRWLFAEISLFDMVDMNGWSQGNSYHIKKLDDRSNSESTMIANALSSGLEYDIDNVCLDIGHYYVELSLHSGLHDPGVQLELPQCSSLFIAPLSYKRFFNIVSREIFFTTSNSVRSTIVGACDIVTSNKAHGAAINITLFEGGGIGWIGAYFSVHAYSATSSLITGQTDHQVNGISADTLEWGYSKGSKLDVTDLFISHDDNVVGDEEFCYLLHLSIPAIEDLEPILAFNEAYEISHGMKTDCSYALQKPSPIVTICRQNQHFEADARLQISFYEHTSSGSHSGDFGQSKESYAQFNSYIQSTQRIENICYIDMNVDDILRAINLSFVPTSQPTGSPSKNSSESTLIDIDDAVNGIPFGLSKETRNAVVIFMIIIQVILIFFVLKFVLNTREVDNVVKDGENMQEDITEDNDDSNAGISVLPPSSSALHTSMQRPKDENNDSKNNEDIDFTRERGTIKNPLHQMFKTGGNRKGAGQRYEMISLDSSSHQLDVSTRGDDDTDDYENDDSVESESEEEVKLYVESDVVAHVQVQGTNTKMTSANSEGYTAAPDTDTEI